jgi:V/A-type H+-transporting ATPase subunit I
VIVPMARVEVVGPRDLFPAALEFVQRHAILELRAPAAPAGRPLRPAVIPTSPATRDLEEAVRRIDALAARLPPARGGRPEPLPAAGTERFAARLDELEGEVSALEARRTALVREREVTARFSRLVSTLAPLGAGLDPALEPEVYGLALRDDPAAVALLEAEVRRLTEGVCEVKARPIDAETAGILVVVPRSHAGAISRLLFEQGLEEVKLPRGYVGKRLEEVEPLLRESGRALPREIARVDAALASLAARAGPPLASARRAAHDALERLRALAMCGETHFTFMVAGYMPAHRVQALRSAAARELPGPVEVFARPPSRAEWGEVPVVLRTPAVARPFGRLLGLVELPRYGSVDPTPWLAVFFPLFFGLVLGDVAFGVLGILAALLVRRAGWGGAAGRDFAAVALWCSLSAVLFGLLFGEALGGLGARLGLRPLLLERRTALMPLLGLALGVGWVHLTVGMTLGVTSAVRTHQVRRSVARASRLLLLALAPAGAGLALGYLPASALLPLGIAAAVLLAVGVAAEGPMAALELVLALGNVLSYARLMALGLASVMFAEVANRVAGTLEPVAAGIALGVLLHLVNFSLGLVSPAIASLRLHYVEFFDKFYDEGGFPFRPFGVSR